MRPLPNRRLLLALALLAAACHHREAEPRLAIARMDPARVTAAPARTVAPAAAAVPAPPARATADDVLAAMDRKADPCADFYRYACGGWMSATKLPPDYSRWGRGFTEIHERNLAEERAILEEAARATEGEPDLLKLGAFYGACLDEEAIERQGQAPLQPYLDEIARVQGPDALMAAAGQLQRIQVPVLFNVDIAADFKDPDLEIVHVGQGGLGLPDREYYLKDDERSRKLREDYQAHVKRMLALLGEGEDTAARHAAAIVQLETELAKVSIPREELRDPDKTYHKLDRDGLQKLTPRLSWEVLFRAAAHPGIRDVNVEVPGFFAGLDKAVEKTDADTLQAYLRWHLVHRTARHLAKAFVDESFAFYGQRLSGQKELQPRWKRCVGYADEALGEALGRLFVARRFAGDSKSIGLEMIGGIEAAFAGGLKSLPWMDAQTRGRAVEKMNAITNKIGYPDVWRDYTKLEVRPHDHFGNAIAGLRFESDRLLDRVGGAVDRKEWGMTPPQVNAYYNASINEIVFPAGILQRPFFDRSFPAPMNYGGIGMVMGHELTHGFDDEGRKFDPKGKLRAWWEPAVAKRFEGKASCVEHLYSSFEVEPGVHVNGKLTLGENIADLGGVKEAYRAYKAWVQAHGEPPPLAAELSNDQLFFVGFAQTWCTVTTPEADRLLVATNPHSPERFRVNGPLSAFPEFGETFRCAKGSPMRPASPCEVW